MGRNIGAGIAGVVVAGLLVWIVESVGHAVFPPPPDLDFANADAMRAYIDTLPLGALLFVAAAWFIGTLGGTLTACKLGTGRRYIYALVVGGLILAATVVNLVMIPHPMWFSALGIVGIVAGAWLGLKLSGGALPEAG